MSNEPVLTVEFFKTPTGNEPVREWLRSLDPEDRTSIGADIKSVQYGWPIGMPLVEKIENNLWVVRSRHLTAGIAWTFLP